MSIFSDRRVPQPRPAGHVERAFNPDMVTDEHVTFPPQYQLTGWDAERLDTLEAMVKRIAAHLGIEG